MNAVAAANKAEIAMMHAVLTNKFGQLYADIWKAGVNIQHGYLVTSFDQSPLFLLIGNNMLHTNIKF